MVKPRGSIRKELLHSTAAFTVMQFARKAFRKALFDLYLVFQNKWCLLVVSLPSDTALAPGTRSSVQECAISIALMMFGLILERFMTLFKGILASADGLKKCDKPRQPKERKRVDW